MPAYVSAYVPAYVSIREHLPVKRPATCAHESPPTPACDDDDDDDEVLVEVEEEVLGRGGARQCTWRKSKSYSRSRCDMLRVANPCGACVYTYICN